MNSYGYGSFGSMDRSKSSRFFTRSDDHALPPSDKPKSFLRTVAGAAKFGIDSMDDVAAAMKEVLPLSAKAIAGAIGGAFMLLSIMQFYDSYLEYEEWDKEKKEKKEEKKQAWWDDDDGLDGSGILVYNEAMGQFETEENDRLFHYFNVYRVYSNFVFDLNSFALSVAYVLAPWVTVLGAELFPFIIMASMTEKSFMKLLEVWGEYNKAQNKLNKMDENSVPKDSPDYLEQQKELELLRNAFIFQCVDFVCTASITSLIGMVTFWALVTASQVPTLGLSIPVVIILSIAVIAITSKWLQNRREKQIEAKHAEVKKEAEVKEEAKEAARRSEDLKLEIQPYNDEFNSNLEEKPASPPPGSPSLPFSASSSEEEKKEEEIAREKEIVRGLSDIPISHSFSFLPEPDSLSPDEEPRPHSPVAGSPSRWSTPSPSTPSPSTPSPPSTPFYSPIWQAPSSVVQSLPDWDSDSDSESSHHLRRSYSAPNLGRRSSS